MRWRPANGDSHCDPVDFPSEAFDADDEADLPGLLAAIGIVVNVIGFAVVVLGLGIFLIGATVNLVVVGTGSSVALVVRSTRFAFPEAGFMFLSSWIVRLIPSDVRDEFGEDILVHLQTEWEIRGTQRWMWLIHELMATIFTAAMCRLRTILKASKINFTP